VSNVDSTRLNQSVRPKKGLESCKQGKGVQAPSLHVQWSPGVRFQGRLQQILLGGCSRCKTRQRDKEPGGCAASSICSARQVTACAARPCSAPRPTGKRQIPHPPPPPRGRSRVRPPWPPSRGQSPRRRRQGRSPARGPHARRAAVETATWRSRGCACARRRRQLPAWRAENCRTACASGVKVRTPTARCFHSARKEGTRCCRASFPARFIGSRRDGQAAKTGLGRHTVAPVVMVCEAHILQLLAPQRGLAVNAIPPTLDALSSKNGFIDRSWQYRDEIECLGEQGWGGAPLLSPDGLLNRPATKRNLAALLRYAVVMS
jgi:hypothetical protein